MHRTLRWPVLLAAAFAALAPAARADVVVNPIFTDHAVLQRDRPITIWGTSDPGEQVSVTLSTETMTTGSTTASAEGRWIATLTALPAGGPYTLTVQGRNRVEFKDVLVGEVWVCSGQSNMEWQLKNSFEAAKDIAAAANPKLRLFTVPHTT